MWARDEPNVAGENLNQYGKFSILKKKIQNQFQNKHF
jgi:hypothetical protein